MGPLDRHDASPGPVDRRLARDQPGRAYRWVTLPSSSHDEPDHLREGERDHREAREVFEH